MHKNSPYYQIEFYIDGDRVRGSSKTRNKKEAEAIEQQWLVQKIAELEQIRRTGSGPMTLEQAFTRYWHDKGHGRVNAGTIWTDLQRMQVFFGGDTRLDAIADSHVMALVTWRQGHQKQGKTVDKDGNPMPLISPATVNRSTTGLLKAVCTYAKKCKQQLPLEPTWNDHFLEEPEERVRELYDEEAAAFEAAIRPDYALWLEFASLTGVRHQETIIKWSEVNEWAKTITTVGKGRRKVEVRITPAIKEILDQCRGHHKVWVFTYICKRPDTPHAKAMKQVKGQRYPITVEGSKTQWARMRKRSKVQDFRLHDLRHNVGTKVLRQTGNLKLVQKVLNHRNIATTARYAHAMPEDVEQAMNDYAKSRKKSRNALRKVG